MALDTQLSNIFVFSWLALGFYINGKKSTKYWTPLLGALQTKEKRESHNTMRVVPWLTQFINEISKLEKHADPL